MKQKQLLLIGGGGHCKSVIDVIDSTDEFEVAGIIDTPEKVGQPVLNHKIIGSDNDLIDLVKKFPYALITAGQINNPNLRIRLFNHAKRIGFIFPIVIANTANVSAYSTIKEGTVIMHQALVNAHAVIEENCIINTKALVEHDCFVGMHSHISTGSILNGTVRVGQESFIGSSSVIFNNISISAQTIIGGGSIVAKDITEAGIYFGNPLKKQYE